ncbi:baseplate hub [Vibrio phage D479]
MTEMKKFDLNVMKTPHTTVTLPQSGEVIKMRSLTAGEHKLLNLANESEQKIDAIEQCLEKSILSDVKIEDLHVADAEYLFVQMYANSNGSPVLTAEYHCAAPKSDEELQAIIDERKQVRSDAIAEGDEFADLIVRPEPEREMTADELVDELLRPDEKVCGERIRCEIDLNKTFVTPFAGSDMVKVNDQVAIKLKHPNIRGFEENDPTTSIGLFNLATEAISEVHVGDTMYTKQELQQQGMLVQIMDQLSIAAFTQIRDFIDQTPRLTVFIDVKCPKCGNFEKIALSGIDDFFV